jgi:hypothetical protein
MDLHIVSHDYISQFQATGICLLQSNQMYVHVKLICDLEVLCTEIVRNDRRHRSIT